MSAYLPFAMDLSQWQPWLTAVAGLGWAVFVWLTARVLLGGRRRSLRRFASGGGKQWWQSEPHAFGRPSDFAYQVEQMWK